jgi:large subunit ribosomal protein L21
MENSLGTGPYSIIQTGGKQYQAAPGRTLAIEKLNANPGDTVTFEQVLVRKTVSTDGKEDIQIGQPFVQAAVKAVVLKHDRGPKIIVFHFKRRKKYKRKMGHRQSYTVVRIESI